MGIFDGFLFWLGKILAEVALFLGISLTIVVICVIVSIISDIKRNRKVKK